MPGLTKAFYRSKLGYELDSQLAGFFGVSASAVCQWADERPIPEFRQMQAERLRPDLFGPEASVVADQANA